MTLQQLRYVIQAADSRSMNEAAKALYISQPSLSGAIKELEKEIGIELFKRSSHGTVLTPEGEEFLGYARQVTDQYQLLENRYIYRTKGKKKFSVSMQHYSFAVKAFVELVKQFGMDEYEFAVYETRTYDVLMDVKNFKSELGILYRNDFNAKVLNKLLKVLEDRRVMLDSAYYNPDDATIPRYIHDIFHNGLPADFRLVGATTRSPSEISPALRSRCMEVFFRALTPEEIALIASGAAERAGCAMAKQEAETIGRYAACGRDAVNIVQMCAGLAQMDERTMILPEDVAWVVQSGHYTIHAQQKADVSNRVGVVHGLAVYGENQGALLDLEAVATPGHGEITVTGIIDEEEIGQEGHKMRRRSTAHGAAENVRTLLKSLGYTLENTDLHINFPGGMPVDGPSAGVAMAVAAVSALTDTPVDGTMAVTGEITVQGKVKAVGGVPQKVEAACQAGLLRVLIPKENDAETLHIAGVEVQGIDDVHQALSAMLVSTKTAKKLIPSPLPMPEKVAAAAAEPSA